MLSEAKASLSWYLQEKSKYPRWSYKLIPCIHLPKTFTCLFYNICIYLHTFINFTITFLFPTTQQENCFSQPFISMIPKDSSACNNYFLFNVMVDKYLDYRESGLPFIKQILF